MDAILSLIKVNEEIDYGRVILIVLIYVAALWLMISIWAGRDAAKRYSTPWAGIVWGVAVFFLGFPAFMFYLVVRPEEAHDASTGGVHIPIANFVDTNRDEIVMGVQLVLHTKQLTDAVRDMRIDIDWESSDSAKLITPDSIGKEAAEVERKLTGLGNIYKSLKQRIDSSLEDAKAQGEKRRREREEKQRQKQEEQKLKLEAAVAAAKATEAAKVSEAEVKTNVTEVEVKANESVTESTEVGSQAEQAPSMEPQSETATEQQSSDQPTSQQPSSDQSASENAPLAQATSVAQTLVAQGTDSAEGDASVSGSSSEQDKPQPHPAYDLFAGRRHKKKKHR